jgi:hypothetical protein
MEVDESFAGRPARCPTCGANLKVPAEGESRATATAKPPPGAARITVGGESVDVLPPLETMVIVSLACVALALAVFLAAGLVKFVTPPWTIGALLGFLVAMLGMIMAVPAYHSVRRSKGRKRGRTHAVIAMAAGGVLSLAFLVVFIVGLGLYLARPTCTENLKHIYAALRQYAEKHNGAFPAELETLVREGYLDSAAWLTCPAHKMPVGTNTYVLTPEINVQATRPDGKPWWPPDTLIASDGRPDAHKDGQVRVLLLNGEVRRIPADEWYTYRKTQSQQWSQTVNELRRAREEAPGDDDASAEGNPP